MINLRFLKLKNFSFFCLIILMLNVALIKREVEAKGIKMKENEKCKFPENFITKSEKLKWEETKTVPQFFFFLFICTHHTAQQSIDREEVKWGRSFFLFELRCVCAAEKIVNNSHKTIFHSRMKITIFFFLLLFIPMSSGVKCTTTAIKDSFNMITTEWVSEREKSNHESLLLLNAVASCREQRMNNYLKYWFFILFAIVGLTHSRVLQFNLQHLLSGKLPMWFCFSLNPYLHMVEIEALFLSEMMR